MRRRRRRRLDVGRVLSGRVFGIFPLAVYYAARRKKRENLKCARGAQCASHPRAHLICTSLKTPFLPLTRSAAPLRRRPPYSSCILCSSSRRRRHRLRRRTSRPLLRVALGPARVSPSLIIYTLARGRVSRRQGAKAKSARNILERTRGGKAVPFPPFVQ